jgi:hypothetical protein
LSSVSLAFDCSSVLPMLFLEPRGHAGSFAGFGITAGPNCRGRGDVAAGIGTHRQALNCARRGPLSRPLPQLRGRGDALRLGTGATQELCAIIQSALHSRLTPNPSPEVGPKLGEGSPAVARNEREAGRGRGPEGRGGGARWPHNSLQTPGNQYHQRQRGVQEFGISCRIPPSSSFRSGPRNVSVQHTDDSRMAPRRVHKRARGVYAEAPFRGWPESCGGCARGELGSSLLVPEALTRCSVNS